VAGDADGEAQLRESLRLALEHDLPEHAARAWTNLGSAGVQSRQYATALADLDAGIAYCIERDLDSWTLYMRGWRAKLHFEQGRWSLATDDADAVIHAAHVPAISRIPALAVLGHVRARRGDPGAAPILDDALTLATETGELQRIAPVALARAELAWLRGDIDRARAEVEPAYAMAASHGSAWNRAELGCWLWRCGALRGASGAIDDWPAPIAATVTGEWARAAREWERLGCPYEQALALADGDDDACTRALDILDRLGAQPAAAQVRERMHARGARSVPRGPRASTRANAFGLTAREIEVLALLADNLSNAEIAARLHRSAKTVDHHVSSILEKLNVDSRRAAVRAARDAGLLPQK
jgi:DNA-binding CsgD family transcriptional regulator